jgi:DNA-binding CsgD family transcriptional regulator
MLINQKDYEKARRYMSYYEQSSGLFDDHGDIEKGYEIYYYYKGLTFLENSNVDSAEYYFRKDYYNAKDYNNQQAAAKGLAMLFEKIGISDSASKYYKYAYAMNDSMYAQMTTSEVERMQAMYDYTRHQEIARKAEQKAERARTGIVAILAVGVVILAIGAFFYQQYRNKKKAEIQQLNNDYGRALQEYNKLSAELERMKQQDDSLILDKQQEVEELKARLQTYQAALQTNGPSQQLSVFQESSIMQTFRTKSRVSPQTPLPTETEWKRLVSQFSRSLPYAYAALGRDVILSTNELRVCILLLSGFKIADVAVLLDTSPQSVTNLKARANNKLFGESSASTLERNLINTVGLA